MMSAWIKARVVAVSPRSPRGKTYQVLYRRGGRHFPIESAGTFKTDKEAKARRDLVSVWLANGLNPRDELAKLTAAPPKHRTFLQVAEAMIASRHDAADNTIRGKRKSIDKIRELKPELLEKEPGAWTVGDVQELVAAMVKSGLAPSSVDKYLTDGPKLVLEFAGVTPNVARDKRVKVPSQVTAEVSPPTATEVLAILRRVPSRHLLALVVLEQTAMRVGEIVSLPWGDVDEIGNRFRLSRERTKTRHPRWVQVPDWLMRIIAGRCPPEDRTDVRRVFASSESALRQAMSRACRGAGIPVYSPHDLRHRRASLWHGQGISVRELMERGGWSRSEIAIDTYSHVMPLEEIPRAKLEKLLGSYS
jgi:site-specific recombinase XerD